MDHHSELTFAKKLAYDAGAIIRKYFSLNIKVEMKQNITPVTIADTEINELVIKRITEKYPDHAIIAEEESLDHNAEYTWICDPLDGTIPYSLGMPTSMFSLALYRNKHPVLGVLYDPYMDRLYYSIDKNESYLNGEKIHVSSGNLKPGDNFGAVFMNSNLIDAQKFLDPLFQKKLRFTQIHSFVYLVCYIATGHLKGAVLPPAYIWDRAASKIILENAGGKITDENGKDLNIYSKPKLVIASNTDCHEEFLKLVQSALISH